MNEIICGDALAVLRTMPNESVNTCVSSPPYFGLRNYSCDGQIGLATTPESYINKLVEIFREVRRVLKQDGTMWINIADSYNSYKGNAKSDTNGSKWAGFRNQPARQSGFGLEVKNLKPKDLIGIPWMLAFALREDGWYLRQDIIWQKLNPIPESVTDRCTKSHEYIFLLSKKSRYYYDNKAIMEPVAAGTAERLKRGVSASHKYINGASGQTAHNLYKPRESRVGEDIELPTMRNKRNIWTTSTNSYRTAHFATFPVELITPCILAGCPSGGVVLDPFIGSGTTAIAAIINGRNYIGIDLNPDFCALAIERIKKQTTKGVI